jgi:hypothetical protein
MLCLRRMLDMSSSLLSAFPNSEYSYSFLHMRNRKKISCTFVTASIGLAISDNIKYSSEDRIDGTSGLFRRNSGCSVEQKILGIPFRKIPQGRKMLGIMYC